MISKYSNRSSNSIGSVSKGHPSEVRTVVLFGVPIVALLIDSQERLSLAQISNTLLKVNTNDYLIFRQALTGHGYETLVQLVIFSV